MLDPSEMKKQSAILSLRVEIGRVAMGIEIETETETRIIHPSMFHRCAAVPWSHGEGNNN